MTFGFSHPVLSCVLEHMEALKRFHLTTHCPGIQKFEKSIPLKIQKLTFQNGETFINDQKFEIQKSCEEIPEEIFPGDISTRPQNYSNPFFELKIFETFRFPNGLKIHEAHKLLSCILFEGRSKIFVDFLKIDISKNGILRLPENQKFSVKNFDTNLEHLEHFFPIINMNSVLKSLRTKIARPSTLDLPIVKNCENLEILEFDASLYPKLSTLSNPKIKILDSKLPKNEIIRLIDNWTDFGKEIGMEITMDFLEDQDFTVLDFLKEVKEIFDGRTVHFEPQGGCSSAFTVSIPMHPNISELVIYGIEKSLIKMEVVPEGTTFDAPMTQLISLEEAKSRRITVVEGETKKRSKKSHARNALKLFMCGFKN